MAAAEGTDPPELNIDEIVAYIEDSGFSGALPGWLYQPTEHQDDLASIELVHFLVETAKGSTAGADGDWKTKYERANSDVSMLLGAKKTLTDEVYATKQQLLSMNSKVQILADKHNTEKQRLEREIDTLQKQIAYFRQRDNQFQHELRRGNLEIDQLKDKLRVLISGSKSSKPSMTIQAAPDHEASTLGTSRTQLEQLRLAVESYDKKSQVLVRENEQLKALLETLTKEIGASHGAARAAEAVNVQVLTKMKDRIEEVLRGFSQPSPTATAVDLQVKLAEYKKAMQEQEQLLSAVLTSTQ